MDEQNNNQSNKQLPVTEENTVNNNNTAQADTEQKGFSITALVCGILSICCLNIYVSIVLSILGIVFGVIGKKKGAAKLGQAGMVCGIVGLSFIVIFYIIAFLLVFLD